MKQIIIRQLSKDPCNAGTLSPYDVVILVKRHPILDEEWLLNKKRNGWHKNLEKAYTKFLLILEG